MEEKEFPGAYALAGSFATQEPPAANREYKDRLFKAIFGRNTAESKRWRLDLYNALNGTAYTDPDELKLTTIENVIYVTMKNDISFLIGSKMNLYEQPLPYGKLTTSCEARSRGGSQMNLYEQQSSYNPNMPLRGLMYFAQLYQMNLSARGLDLFGSKLVKIPAPSFVVFYNGDRKLPDVSEQRLPYGKPTTPCFAGSREMYIVRDPCVARGRYVRVANVKDFKKNARRCMITLATSTG